MENIRYGLRLKKSGDILGCDVRSNGTVQEEYSSANELSYYLTDNDRLWLVNSKDQVEDVKFKSVNMYESSYDYPEHYYKPEELEIVEVVQTFSIQPVDEGKILKIKLRADYTDERYTLYDFRRKIERGGGLILSKVLQENVITAKDEGAFYKILNISPQFISFSVYKYVKKEDFVIV